MFKLKKNQKDTDPPHKTNFSYKETEGFPPPRILPRNSHNLSRKLIDPDALNILYRLTNKGYLAYLVGGCVRDILLNLKPKDFDVCTNARPSRVRKIFRNCRLIGRRFRLAHIIFRGKKIIEISTFRREPDYLLKTEDRRELAIHSNSYYGTPAEDAWRRDFTINALFYNIQDFSIIDYVGGVSDLQNKLIRIIGDPDKRFYEDPVRMMRGIEFAARLGFSLEPETLEGIKRCRAEIRHGSPARIKEEILAILQGGYGYRCFSLFFETGLFPFMFPEFRPWEEWQTQCLLSILKHMDDSIAAGYIPSDHLCFSAFLWPFISGRLAQEEIRHMNELDIFLRDLINPFCYYFHLRIHSRHLMKEIYRVLWRIRRGTGYKGEHRLIRKEFFPEAMTLFRWLAVCNQIDQELVDRWDRRITQLRGSSRKSRNRRRKSKRKIRGR